MTLEIDQRCRNHRRIVSPESDSSVAPMTQKSPNSASLMVVVNTERRPSRSGHDFAYCALVALRYEHCIILLDSEPVFSQARLSVGVLDAFASFRMPFEVCSLSLCRIGAIAWWAVRFDVAVWPPAERFSRKKPLAPWTELCRTLAFAQAAQRRADLGVMFRCAHANIIPVSRWHLTSMPLSEYESKGESA